MTIKFELNLQKVNSGELGKEDFLESIVKEIEANMLIFQKNAVKLVEGAAVGKCPKCGRELKPGKNNWYCPGYNQEPKCEFSLWKTVAGKKISDEVIKELLQKKKTGLIKGFKNKAGNTFDAYLILDSDNKVAFAFKL